MKKDISSLPLAIALAAGLVLSVVPARPACAQTAFPAQTQSAEQRELPSYYRVKASTDWGRLSLKFTIDIDVVAAGFRMPGARLEAERSIDHDLPALMEEALFGIRLDAGRTLEGSLEDGSVNEQQTLELAARARLDDENFSGDFHYFTAVYELPLTAVMALFIRHSSALQLEAPLEYRASRPYTGIIIIAQGRLPVHGEQGQSSALSPCLFPRVYDEDMNLLVDRNHVAPEAIRAWGELGYTSKLDSAGTARAGAYPLRIVARAFFGTSRTDLIISRDDALKITSLPENRALIEQGKILVVLDSVSETVSY